MTHKPRALELAEQFRPYGKDTAPIVARAVWRQLSVVERAALYWNWRFWARQNQLPPPGEWKTWGFLTGRRFGKTAAVSSWINEEVEAGRATLIGLCAQDEQSSIDIQVAGPSGLIATAMPRHRPRFSASDMQLTWPNGARAYIRTPEVPGKIRGLEYQLFWASELQSWPKSTQDEALANVFLSTSIGYARVVWDATAKRRHPLLKRFLAQHEAHPREHVIVRGTTWENQAHLAPGFVADMERMFGGTARSKEEIYGLMLEEAEGALVRQTWIDDARRLAPNRYVRRVISIDPAVTDRKGSDSTGIIDAGLGEDGQVYVLGDATKPKHEDESRSKYTPQQWAALVLDWYRDRGCDLVIAETNKGGSLVTQNLRALAQQRGLEVVVIDKDARCPTKQDGKLYVREVYARGAKEDRAEPVATAYSRKRISHVIGVDLNSLEDTLTTWEPAPNADSPGDLDALVHAVVELLSLSRPADPTPAKLDDFFAFRKIAPRTRF